MGCSRRKRPQKPKKKNGYKAKRYIKFFGISV